MKLGSQTSHRENAEEGVVKRIATVGENVNWYTHYGEQYAASLKN